MHDEMILKCELFSTTPLTDESGDCVEYSQCMFSESLVQSMKSLHEDSARVRESEIFRTIFYRRAYEIAIDMKRERPDLVVKVFFPDNIFSDEFGLVEIHFRETHSLGLIDERCDDAESAEELDDIMMTIAVERISLIFRDIRKILEDVVDDMQKKNVGRSIKKMRRTKNKGCK